MHCFFQTTVASNFLLLQESVRDAVDLYWPLKCPPVVLVNDTPCGFARHLDLREPTVGSELWGDCVGCFQRPDPDTEPKEVKTLNLCVYSWFICYLRCLTLNYCITLFMLMQDQNNFLFHWKVSVPEIVPSEFSSNNLSEGRLCLDLANPLQHPLTGSTRRYVVGDRFHTTTNPHKSNLCAYHDINLCLQSDTIKTSYQECQNNSKNIKRLRCSTMQSFPVHFLYNFLIDFYHNENIVEKQRKQLSLTLKEGQVLQRDKFLRFVVLDNRNY